MYPAVSEVYLAVAKAIPAVSEVYPTVGKAIVFVAIVFWLFVFCLPAVVIVGLILRHRQRMAMIEKGIAPQPKTPQAHLRRGLILSFIGGSITLIGVYMHLLLILRL